jgi:hypothetical protein
MTTQRLIFCDCNSRYLSPEFQKEVAPGGKVRSVVFCDDFLIFLERYQERWLAAWYEICQKLRDSEIEIYIPAGYPIFPKGKFVKFKDLFAMAPRWQSVFCEIQKVLSMKKETSDHRRHFIMTFKHIMPETIPCTVDILIHNEGMLKKEDADTIFTEFRNIVKFKHT